MTSGQRTSECAIKRVALHKGKPDHEAYKCGACELNTRADTICAGHNFCALSFTGMTCEVHGFHESLDTVHNVPVAQVETAFIRPTTHNTFILIVDEALYFGRVIYIIFVLFVFLF